MNPRSWRYLIAGVVLVALGVGLGALVMSSQGRTPIDDWWMQTMVATRNDVLTSVAHALDWLGGGWRATYVIPLLIIATLLLLRRRWAALAFVAALLASVGVVQLLKSTFGRARPAEMIVTSDFGSFPSGHVANAITMTLVLALILRFGWLWIVTAVWVLAMAWSRTYLGAHWLTDTVGGALAGAGVVLIVVALFSHLLGREAHRREARASIG